LETIIKAMALCWILLLILRIIPRRTGNIMTPFEFILLFLLGGMGVQAVLGEDRSFTNALLGLMSVALMRLLVATLKQHFRTFGKLGDGTPSLVFEKGKWHEDRMNALRLQARDVMAAARQQGIANRDQIRYAVVERNGSVSVFPNDEK
jgi:uncharacterized membrane protein YcaP (DUF421 family)